MPERLRALALVVWMAFRTDPRRATVVLVLNLGVSLSVILHALWFKLLVDAATRHDMRLVVVTAVAAAATAAVLGLAAMGQYVFAGRLSDEVGQAFDEEMMRISSTLPGLEHHERPDYLDKLNLLRTDRWTLTSAVWAVFINLGLVAQVAGSMLLLARVDLRLLLLPLFAVPYVLLGGRAEILGLNANEEAAPAQRLGHALRELGTTPAPAKEVRMGRLRQLLLRRHRDAAAAALAPMARAQRQGTIYNAIGAVIFGCGFVGAGLLVVLRATQGQATLGDVVMALTIASQVNQQLAQAVGAISWLLQTLRGAGRFLWLRDYAATASATRRPSQPVPDRITRGIDLEHVTFRYPGTAADVLSDVTLHIPAGTTVAVVGENGAGKTSLVKLLNRFYEPVSGVIRVDGVDIADIDVEEWRARHSACFQDFTNFAFRVRETVGVGDLPRIDDLPRVEAALAAANAAELPERLEAGLDTLLTKRFEGGTELSGGQWQKLALGRAMMREAPLLLALDEPSSGLDAQAEHSLFERYAGAAQRSAAANGAITVLVSHRFSTVRMADLIVVLDGGRLVEAGSHDELMALGGQYAELYEIQASAYR